MPDALTIKEFAELLTSLAAEHNGEARVIVKNVNREGCTITAINLYGHGVSGDICRINWRCFNTRTGKGHEVKQ